MIQSGKFLGDRYEILEKIGSGGMADVYRARCHKLNRFVAIKILKEEFCDDRVFVKKFTEEAQAAACLSHANIVGIYDVNEEDNIHYIVMELLDGVTLKEYIRYKGSLSAEETVSIALQVAEGLRAAHAQNIIHRDVKPQNIMITKDNKVKVADFGIAHVMANGATINTISMGSVHYSSPEQNQGRTCDARSDIYSLGVTMYEMITGIVPFDGDSVVNIALAHANDAVVKPSKIVEMVPADVEAVILKCLEKRPEERYATAGDLIEALRNTEAARSLVVPMESHLESEESPEVVEEEKATMGDKVLGVLNVGGGVVIIVLLLYIAVRWTGILPNKTDVTKSEIAVSQSDKETNGTQQAAQMSENTGVRTTMPNCMGLSVDEAEELLASYDLVAEYDAEWEYSDDYEEGTICKQEFDEGEELDKYTKVKLVISLGTDKFEITDEYIGMTKTRFEQIVKQYELDIKYKPEYNENISRGVIYKMSPSSGKVKRGSKLTVYYSLGPQYVNVPSVVGLLEEDARQTLTSSGLKVGNNVSEAYSNDYEAGIVISQSLDAGTQVKADSEINYVVSLGRKTVYVPSVVGKQLDEAQSILSSYELEASVTEQYSSEYAAGVVISQDPSEGAQRKSGDTVGLVVSLGDEAISVDVAGKSEKDARSALEKLGLKVAGTREENSDSIREGYVIRVEKQDGSGEFHRGDSVILIVSKGVETASVPSVLNQTREEAISSLESAGFYVSITEKTITVKSSEAATLEVVDGQSRVTYQSVTGEAALGTTVDITVEVYRVEEEQTVEPTQESTETQTAESSSEQTVEPSSEETVQPTQETVPASTESTQTVETNGEESLEQ